MVVTDTTLEKFCLIDSWTIIRMCNMKHNRWCFSRCVSKVTKKLNESHFFVFSNVFVDIPLFQCCTEMVDNSRHYKICIDVACIDFTSFLLDFHNPHIGSKTCKCQPIRWVQLFVSTLIGILYNRHML